MVVEKTYEVLINEGLIAIILPNHSSFSAKIYRGKNLSIINLYSGKM